MVLNETSACCDSSGRLSLLLKIPGLLQGESILLFYVTSSVLFYSCMVYKFLLFMCLIIEIFSSWVVRSYLKSDFGIISSYYVEMVSSSISRSYFKW